MFVVSLGALEKQVCHFPEGYAISICEQSAIGRLRKDGRPASGPSYRPAHRSGGNRRHGITCNLTSIK